MVGFGLYHFLFYIAIPFVKRSVCEDTMVTIGMNYEVLKGKEEVFEKAFARIISTLEGVDGHESSRLLRDVHQARNYAIHSRWSDEESFKAFVASEQFAKVTDWGKEQVLASRPDHVVYRTED
jgi:heme-degrading monooxygenase HmoA